MRGPRQAGAIRVSPPWRPSYCRFITHRAHGLYAMSLPRSQAKTGGVDYTAAARSSHLESPPSSSTLPPHLSLRWGWPNGCVQLDRPGRLCQQADLSGAGRLVSTLQNRPIRRTIFTLNRVRVCRMRVVGCRVRGICCPGEGRTNAGLKGECRGCRTRHHSVIRTRVPVRVASNSEMTSLFERRIHPMDAGCPSFSSAGVPWM